MQELFCQEVTRCHLQVLMYTYTYCAVGLGSGAASWTVLLILVGT